MWRDDAYLLNMLLAGRKAIEFVAGATGETFQTDEILQNAAVRQIQIIGEAARMISAEFKQRTRRFRGRKSWECEIVWYTSILTLFRKGCGK